MSHTVDPLSIEETNLVNELLFGPNNDDNHSCISKSSVASASASSNNKRSKSIVKEGIDATTVISMDGDSSIGNGSGTLLSTQIERDSWVLGGGGDESATGASTSDCCSSSVVSNLTELKIENDEKIIIPPPTTTTTTTATTTTSSKGSSKGSSSSSIIVIPDVYIKNKKLVEEADHSRFKKTFKELSEMKLKKNKLLKSSDVQKHLDYLALSLMKDNNQTTSAKKQDKDYNNDNDFPTVDIVASLNGIHMICYNILQESKYIKHSKIVALCFSILSSLAKTTISKKYDNDRRALIAKEHGVLVILSCMQKFNPSKELLVYEEGVVALYNIVQHIDNAIELCETQQALGIILQTMKVHSKRLSIQKSCLGILLRLAHVDFLYVAKHNVFTICISNLKKSCAIKNGQASLQKVGCLFWRRLMTLAVGGEGKNTDDQYIHEIKLMIQCGVPEYLLESLKQFGINDSSIASNCIATFTMLSECQLIKERTVLLYNLSDIIKIILKHKTDVNTQRESLKLLRTLHGLPVGSLKLSRSLINDSDVRRLFQMSQINPNQLLPL